jgi:hypothetical protein
VNHAVRRNLSLSEGARIKGRPSERDFRYDSFKVADICIEARSWKRNLKFMSSALS